MVRFRQLLGIAALAVVCAAVARAEDDWKLTGSGKRQKSVAFVSVDVYAIEHHAKVLPKTRTKQALIDLECEKKFTWTMLRDVEAEKIQKALEDAFELNGYKDAAKIKAFVGAFKAELKEKKHVTIVYDPAKKETTVTVEGGGTATVGGVEFMKAVWSLWFGKIDQKELGDQLMAKLP